MSKPFYQLREVDFADGANDLVAAVTPAPESFGLTAAIVTSYTALAASFSDLLDLVTNPSTRTPVLVADKNAAKRALRAATLDISAKIRSTPTVTNGQLIGLRLNPRTTPQSQTLPTVRPTIELTGCDGNLAKFKINNTVESDRRGKPKGVAGMYIFTYVGAEAPADVAEYQFQGTATRMTTEVLFPSSVPNGSTVWVICCWVSERGETSIASTPMSFVLQGGSVSMLAKTESDNVRLAA